MKKFMFLSCLLSLTAQAAVYDCSLFMTEEVPLFVSLENAVGDGYSRMSSTTVNDLGNCKVNERSLGAPKEGYRLAVDSCIFIHPVKKFSFNSEEGECFDDRKANTKSCHLKLGAYQEVKLADQDLAKSKGILRTLITAAVVYDLTNPDKNALYLIGNFNHALKIGTSAPTSVSSNNQLKLPLDMPFLQSNSSILTELRTFSTTGADGKTLTVQSSFNMESYLGCVKRPRN